MTASAQKLDNNRPHILIVDDDTRIRELLRKYLMENDYRITTAKDAEEAREQMKGLTFDLLVLDVMMPGESGLDLASHLRKTSDVPILMLTARGEPEDRIEGLERGVDDYLGKPFEPRELLLRIATIIKRTQTEIEEVSEIQMGECHFDLERGELTKAGEVLKMTSAEISLLTILAKNPDQAYTRLDLSEQTGAGLERSVDVQITRIRKKVETNPKIPRYLQTVRGVGYKLVPD
jgi:two-component system phosphate regulon response regulator OmpR